MISNLQREKRQWWAVSDDKVQLVTGWSCAPGNPKMWWCPKAGYSMTEGHHLFATEAEALDKLVQELKARAVDVAKRLKTAQERRALYLLASPASPRSTTTTTETHNDL